MKVSMAAFLCILLVAPAAFADFSVELNTEFSGATPPAGTPPWITANFASLVGGGMELTIDASGLTGSEFVREFYFNLDPAFIAAFLLPLPTGTGTHQELLSIVAGNDVYQANGTGGDFDFLVQFPTAPSSDRFVDGETFILRVGVGNPAITAESFRFQSVGTVFYAAAQIESIGPTGADSGWIAGSTFNTPQTVVPEPGSIILLGTVMGGVFLHLRKRSVARKG
jgi:hypothetical protein